MRLTVLTLVLLFILALGALTVLDIARNGITALAVVAVGVLLLFTIGIVGALREPPRE
jgi:hypothetical protein